MSLFLKATDLSPATSKGSIRWQTDKHMQRSTNSALHALMDTANFNCKTPIVIIVKIEL